MAVDRSLPILIVDDYKTMLRIIRNLLKQIEFTMSRKRPTVPMALAKLRAAISAW